jgi:hypothetical protein
MNILYYDISNVKTPLIEENEEEFDDENYLSLNKE